MKEWEQMLVMAFICLIVSATLLVVVVIDSPSSFYAFWALSYNTYPAKAILEITIGIFALTLGVGLSILTISLHWIHKKQVLPNRLPVPEREGKQ